MFGQNFIFITNRNGFPTLSLLLTHGYFLQDDPKEKKIMKPYPPLGLLYISAFLERAKVQHDVYDSTYGDFVALKNQILQKKYTQIGFYVNMMTKPTVLRLIEFIRSQEEIKGTTIILGGPDVRYNTEE